MEGGSLTLTALASRVSSHVTTLYQKIYNICTWYTDTHVLILTLDTIVPGLQLETAMCAMYMMNCSDTAPAVSVCRIRGHRYLFGFELESLGCLYFCLLTSSPFSCILPNFTWQTSTSTTKTIPSGEWSNQHCITTTTHGTGSLSVVGTTLFLSDPLYY